MKRQLISILFLLILLTPLAGTFTWLQYRKAVVRHEVKERLIEGMDRTELVLFTFTLEQSENDLEWEHSGEFEYKGEMYDVVYTETQGNLVKYWVWWDNDETQLNRQLSHLVRLAQDNDEKSHNGHEKLLVSLKSLYFENTPEFTTARTGIHQDIYFAYLWIYQSIHRSPPTPPPSRV